ncbi:hypothetical protein [Nonomuraea dietziae]|uniref:hypothetical protein n=1 Tax=Nonomuraea dietziae TaxID=65515 RepID=UPI0031D29CED
MALDHAHEGIRVNTCGLPRLGGCTLDMLRWAADLWRGCLLSQEEQVAQWAARIPLGRWRGLEEESPSWIAASSRRAALVVHHGRRAPGGRLGLLARKPPPPCPD